MRIETVACVCVCMRVSCSTILKVIRFLSAGGALAGVTCAGSVHGACIVHALCRVGAAERRDIVSTVRSEKSNNAGQSSLSNRGSTNCTMKASLTINLSHCGSGNEWCTSSSCNGGSSDNDNLHGRNTNDTSNSKKNGYDNGYYFSGYFNDQLRVGYSVEVECEPRGNSDDQIVEPLRFSEVCSH